MGYIEELKELAKLKDDGIITEDEFIKKKEEILNQSKAESEDNNSLEDNPIQDTNENCPYCGEIITDEDLKNKICPHCSLTELDEKIEANKNALKKYYKNEDVEQNNKKNSKNLKFILGGLGITFLLWIFGVFDPPKLKLYENNLIETLSKQKGTWIANVSHIVGSKYYYKVELNSNGRYTEYSSKNKSNWEVQSRGNIEVHKYDITGGRFDYGDRYIGIRLRPNDGSFAHLYRIGGKTSKNHYIPNVGNGREITQLYAETKGAYSYYLK